MLCAVPCNADGVAFLEGVGADEMGRHLPRDADQRDRIHEGIGQAASPTLVAPGPEVTNSTPALPLERA